MPAFDRCLGMLCYQGRVPWLVQQLKYGQQLKMAALLGDMLATFVTARRFGEAPPQALLPVPLHAGRLRRRGFNQALELARPLARRWRVPLLTDCVRRVQATPSQTGLSAAQRRRNLRGAFVVDRPPEARHIALIDDVVTTGSTAAELARVLKKAGVERVEVYCVARVQRNPPN